MINLRKLGLLSAAIASIAIVGCGSGDNTTAAAPGDKPAAKPTGLKIAVIPKGTTHEFWKSVHAGADDAGKELGVEIFWKGPVKENDRDGQINVVDSFVSEKVSGIVLAPLDDTALLTPVQSAIKAGIPVDIIDSALKQDPTVSFVSTDNFKGGQMAGQEMVKLLGGKGRVVVFRLLENSASTHDREEGFIDAIKKAPGITIVNSNKYLGATIDDAQTNSESALNGYKKGDGLDLEGVFCPNESTTFGTLRTLQEGKWAGKIKFVGFDASGPLVDALKGGQIDALVVQNPRKMGYLGVKTLVESIQGKKVEKRIDTGATLVNKANLESDEVKKLLTPVN